MSVETRPARAATIQRDEHIADRVAPVIEPFVGGDLIGRKASDRRGDLRLRGRRVRRDI
jgi:hypothetical protein